MSFEARLNQIMERRKASLFAESKRLAGEALTELQDKQLGNAFWNNQTHQALERLFSNAFMEPDAIGFFIAHGVEYGIYLELANDRQNEALRPMVEKYALKLRLYAQELFGGGS